MAFVTTSIVRALVDDDINVLDTLLKSKQFNFHIDDFIENEIPALHFAVIFRLVDVVKVLLKHGANVNLWDKDSETCLYHAVTRKVSDENVKRVRKILQDVVLDNACKEKLTAPFSTEAKYQERVQQFFQINENLENLDSNIVEYAQFADNTSLIELLLVSGANTNHPGYGGWSPFLEFCWDRYADIRTMNLLLRYGADINLKDDHGNSALGLATEYSTIEVVEKLLDLGADVNESCMDELPLSLTLRCDNKDAEIVVPMIELLVARGAHVNAFNPVGYTPLKSAVHCHSLLRSECLLKLGANPNLYQDQPPLHLCVLEKDVKIAECLINHGADAFYKNPDQSSLLNTAMKNSLWDSFHLDSALKSVTCLMEKGVTIGRYDYIDLTREKIDLLEKCQQELKTLKETKIYPDSRVTYFEFLVKRGKALARCLRDENIAAAMKSEEFKKQFVYFAHRLEANYDHGLKLINTIDGFRSILSDVFKDVFPRELILMISDYFKIEDLNKCFESKFSA